MDNTALLAIALPQLKRDEGCRLAAYPDPLSGADPWTIGYGATGDGIEEGVTWTQDQADSDLEDRCITLCGELDSALSWWRDLDLVRAAVLLNMAYNMGVQGLLGFSRTLAAVRASNYSTASSRMLLSRWAGQVGERADRLAAQMRTGELT